MDTLYSINKPTSTRKFEIGDIAIYAERDVNPQDWLVFPIIGYITELNEWTYINESKAFIKESELVSLEEYKLTLQAFSESQTNLSFVSQCVLRGARLTPNQREQMVVETTTVDDITLAKAYYHIKTV